MTTEPDQRRAQQKVVRYLQSAHAMEEQSLDLLQSLAKQTEDAQFEQGLALHASDTRQHLQLLEERLEALGEGPSSIKDAQNKLGAAMSAALASIRPDQESKNARDAYVMSHLAIAFYEMLERLARRMDDEETAGIARRICENQHAHARKIAAMWDHFVDLSLRETAMG